MIIKTNKPFGKVAGWIPLFKIGGTVSNENVDINKKIETIMIIKKTLNSFLKKKGKLILFALFFTLLLSRKKITRTNHYIALAEKERRERDSPFKRAGDCTF